MNDTKTIGRSSWLRAAGLDWRLVFAAAAACMVVLWVFAPRIGVWIAWWRAPEFIYGPEVGRAKTAVWQAANLGAEIADPIHKILRWRLLFPGIAAGLGLSAFWHLALYPLGALCAAAWALRVLRDRGVAPGVAWLGVLTFAANAWFFTATGWLAYADAWVVLGLLIVAYSRAFWPAVVAGVLFPWCDDRFVLALPFALACRWLAFGETGPRDWKQSLKEGVWVGLGAAVFVVARIFLELSGGTGSLSTYAPPSLSDAPGVFVWGWWEGWRAAWGLVVAALAAVWIRDGSRVAACVALAAAGTFAVAFFTAFDLSRAGLMLCPLVLAGLLVLARLSVGARLIAGLAAINLLLPATHIIANMQTPIWPLRVELANRLEPRPPYAAAPYAQQAVELWRAGQREEALRVLDIARRLDPFDTTVAQSTAILAMEQGAPDRALLVLDAHLLAFPDDRGARVLLAEVLSAVGLKPEAAAHARMAGEGLSAESEVARRSAAVTAQPPR